MICTTIECPLCHARPGVRCSAARRTNHDARERAAQRAAARLHRVAAELLEMEPALALAVLDDLGVP